MSDQLYFRGQRAISIKRTQRPGKPDYVEVTFGTTDVRDLSGGAFPVEVIRRDQAEDGAITDGRRLVCRKPATLAKAVRRCGECDNGTPEQWVEIRALAERKRGGW